VRVLVVFLVLLLFVIGVKGDDGQLYMSCGGDGELVIGCLDDGENAYLGGVISSSGVGVDQRQVVYKDVYVVGNVSKIPEEDSSFLFLILLAVIIILYYIYKYE